MMRQQRRRSRRGNTVVEYALFLALVAGALVLAGDAVSFAMRDSLLQTAAATQGHAPARPVASDVDAPQDDVLTALVVPGESPAEAYQVGAVAVVLALGACVWYAMYCQRVKKPTVATLIASNDELPLELRHDVLFAKRQQILRILASDMQPLLQSRLEVRHLMSHQLLSVKPLTPATEVRDLMHERHVKHLLVCNDVGQLCGIISDRDLLSRTGKTAAELMTSAPISVESHTLVSAAITLLIHKRISCLPVLEAGTPVGVLTTTDMMMSLQCAMQVLQKVASEVGKPCDFSVWREEPADGVDLPDEFLLSR